MILRSNTTHIGKILKTHGINGEVVVNLNYDLDLSELKCVFLDLDSILVPFFAENVRQRSDESVLVKFDGIENETEAGEIVGKEVFASKDDVAEEESDGFYAEDLIGYKAFDGEKYIGEIEDIDVSTENSLFIVEKEDNKTVFIPIADEFIVELDPDGKKIVFDLPTGLTDM